MTDTFLKPFKLIAVETHPIQYKAPLFRLLANDPRVDLTVLYAMIPDAQQQGSGFGVVFAWDVPLLDGYRYEMLNNRALNPSVTCFAGCDTPEIYERLRRDRPDAVLVNGWVVKTCLQTLWACKRLSIPCLVRGEANLLRPRVWWKHALHRLLLKQYSAYLAIGTANHDFYRFHHCSEDRIFSAPYSVDNEWFAAEAAKRSGRRAELRDRFGIPSDAVVFLFAGKLEHKKHPLDLLEALARRSPDLKMIVHVLVAGDGVLRGECEQFARERNLPVTFAGFINQSLLPDAYAAADVMVLPSDAGETWGLVVNEVMASGRPAIVSRSAGCCEDLVIDGKTGFQFDCGDTVTLAQHMNYYLKTPAQAVLHGENAAKHVSTCSISKTAEGVLNSLRQMLNPSLENRSC